MISPRLIMRRGSIFIRSTSSRRIKMCPGVTELLTSLFYSLGELNDDTPLWRGRGDCFRENVVVEELSGLVIIKRLMLSLAK